MYYKKTQLVSNLSVRSIEFWVI